MIKALTDYQKAHYMYIVFGVRKFNSPNLPTLMYDSDFPKLTRKEFLKLKEGWDFEYKSNKVS